MGLAAWVTAPPHADFLAEVAAHPVVEALRLNTVMPVGDGPGSALDRLAAHGVDVWVDLKGRQLRVVEAAVPPFTAVRVSHPVEVPCPADVYFRDGRDHARLVAVDGDRLILEAGPRRVIGPGESVNVVHPGCVVHGTLTATDRAYLEAMRARGMRKVMLSYVQEPGDLDEVRALLPGAEIVPKIESWRGLMLAESTDLGRLCIARGDLFVEVGEPHRILGVTRRLLARCPDAVVASRILSGLAWDPVPECAELSDVAWLHALGARTVMLGDQVCLQRDTVLAALNLLAAIDAELA